MNSSRREPGIYVSGAAHLALLLSAFVVFSDARPIEAPQESVPVDIVTDQQLNELMKGQKDATQKTPAPPKADRIAEVEEKRPTPPVVAKTDTPTPPPPLKRIPDPADDDTPEPPKRVAALPPTPTPPVPTPPKPEARPTPPKAEKAPEPPPKPDAEAIDPPKPPTRPTPPKVEKTPTPPKEEARPKSEQKPLDRTALAKLLNDQKPDENARPASRPKSAAETSDNHAKLDSASLQKLLSHDDPGQKPSTGSAINQTASIGAPNASAAKMSPSMWGQLDALMQEQYKKCWSYLGLNGETHYIPQIKVAYDVNGNLVGQPSLLNPPGDPNIRALADSAMRAVRRCNPLRIPPQFMPYFQQWKDRILRFDPEEMAG